MNWAKVVLIFQAVATLIIGVAFLLQVMQLDNLRIAKLEVTVSSGVTMGGEIPKTDIIDIKSRYSAASYILLTVSILEILLLIRLMR